MTSTITLASQWLRLSDKHTINVTTRASFKNGQADKLKDLTVATVRLWKQVAVAFERGERKLDTNAPEAQLAIMSSQYKIASGRFFMMMATSFLIPSSFRTGPMKTNPLRA